MNKLLHKLIRNNCNERGENSVEYLVYNNIGCVIYIFCCCCHEFIYIQDGSKGDKRRSIQRERDLKRICRINIKFMIFL